jgi:hypothetical protein
LAGQRCLRGDYWRFKYAERAHLLSSRIHFHYSQDMTPFAAEQRQHINSLEQLINRREDVYPITDTALAVRLGLDVYSH